METMRRIFATLLALTALVAPARAETRSALVAPDLHSTITRPGMKRVAGGPAERSGAPSAAGAVSSAPSSATDATRTETDAGRLIKARTVMHAGAVAVLGTTFVVRRTAAAQRGRRRRNATPRRTWPWRCRSHRPRSRPRS